MGHSKKDDTKGRSPVQELDFRAWLNRLLAFSHIPFPEVEEMPFPVSEKLFD